MISRNLFFKLQREDLKRRLWTIPLAFIVFFLSYPITYAISLSNRSDSYNSTENILRSLKELVGATYPMGVIITVVGAIICGMSGYYYVHSKKKIDFFHSIPIRRESLFAIFYLDGILIYLIPYIINLLLSIVVIQIYGYMNLNILAILFTTMIVNTVYYVLIYTVVIIAMMLTGNIIVGFFGTGVLLLYGPMIQIIKELLFQEFFTTYYTSGSSLIDQIQYGSPIGSYIKLTTTVQNTLSRDNLFSLLCTIIVTLVLLGGAISLYKKRPSETAGKAMAFPISEPIIKFALVIALSLGGGIVFRELAYQASGRWFLYGIIIALIVSYGVIESIYNFDIKCMFKHKLQLLACLGISLVIAGIFQYDMIQYDSYLPKKNEIAHMSVSLGGLEQNLNYIDTVDNVSSEYYPYMGGNEYQLKHMKLTDYQMAYTLGLIGSKRTKAIVESDEYGHDYTKYSDYIIKYTLKNGKEVYRRYRVPNEDIMDIVKKLYMNSEYKEAHYPIFNWKETDVMSVSVSNIFDNKDYNLNTAEKKELLESLKKDLLQATIDELINVKPLATLSFGFGKYSSQYYVYPSYIHTIALLQERGYDITRVVETSDIISIRIENYSPENASVEDGVYSYQTMNYTDAKDIDKIFPHLVTRDYVWNNSLIYNIDYDIQIMVVIKTDEYGNESNIEYYFREDRIPEQVKKDIQYNK